MLLVSRPPWEAFVNLPIPGYRPVRYIRRSNWNPKAHRTMLIALYVRYVTHEGRKLSSVQGEGEDERTSGQQLSEDSPITSDIFNDALQHEIPNSIEDRRMNAADPESELTSEVTSTVQQRPPSDFAEATAIHCIIDSATTFIASDQRLTDINTNSEGYGAKEQDYDQRENAGDWVSSRSNSRSDCEVSKGIHRTEIDRSDVDCDSAGLGQHVIQRIAADMIRGWITASGKYEEASEGSDQSTGKNAGLVLDGNSGGGNAQNTSRKLSRKRSIPPSDDEEDTADHSRKRVGRRQSSGHIETVPLLACPYHKFDRSRYSQTNSVEKEYRGCSSRYLPNIARLKQHLQRTHERLKNYCGRCYQMYPTRDELDAHSNESRRCAGVAPRYTERMTDEKALAIRKRHPKRSMEENWYWIWGVLFPETNSPESPYVEEAVKEPIDDFLRYFRLQGPACIHEGLQAAGMLPSVRLLQDITSRVLDEAIAQILTEYNATHPRWSSVCPTSAVENHQQNMDRAASIPDYSSTQVVPPPAIERINPINPVISTSDTSLIGQHVTAPAPNSDISNSNSLPATISRNQQAGFSTSHNPYVPTSSPYPVNYTDVWNLPPSQLDTIPNEAPTDWSTWDLDGMLA